MLFALPLALSLSVAARQPVTQDQIERAVGATVRPLMAKDGIPGMAVGIVDDGKPFFFYYGVASKQTQQPVTSSTLFEVGSISKTFTAALAAYAQVRGFVSLPDTRRQVSSVAEGHRVRQRHAAQSRNAHRGRASAAGPRRGR